MNSLLLFFYVVPTHNKPFLTTYTAEQVWTGLFHVHRPNNPLPRKHLATTARKNILLTGGTLEQNQAQTETERGICFLFSYTILQDGAVSFGENECLH